MAKSVQQKGGGDLFEEVSAPPLDFRQVFVYGIARSWPWIATLALVFGTLGLISAASKPNTYTSEAKLLLRLGEREATNPGEALVGTGQRESRPTMEDEIHILNQDQIYYRVAEEIGPSEVLEPTDPRRYDGESTAAPVRWMHQLQWWLVSRGADVGAEAEVDVAARVLKLSTVIFPESRSNILIVRHTSTSPEKARDTLRMLVDQFIQRHREQFSILGRLEEHRHTVEEAQNARDMSKRDKETHIASCGFVDLQTQFPALITEIEALDKGLFDARIERKEVVNELQSVRGRIQATPKQIEHVTPAVKAVNDQWQSLNTQRNALLIDLGNRDLQNLPAAERDRQKSLLREQIAKLEQELEDVPKEIVVTPERREASPNPDWITLDNRIADLVVQDENLGNRTQDIEGRLREKRQEFDRMQKCDGIHERLETLIAETGDRYETLIKRFSMLEALGQIDLMEESDNLKVVDPPSYTEMKDGPNRKKSLILGFGGGFALGLALAVLREILDPRLRYPEAVERALGVRMLGVVPEANSLSELASA